MAPVGPGDGDLRGGMGNDMIHSRDSDAPISGNTARDTAPRVRIFLAGNHAPTAHDFNP